MENLANYINEEVKNPGFARETDSRGSHITKRCEISFDQVLMLTKLFEARNISEKEFNEIFGNSYAYSEYTQLIDSLKEWKDNY